MQTDILKIYTEVKDIFPKDIYHELVHKWLDIFQPEGDGLVIGLNEKDARKFSITKTYMEKRYKTNVFMVDLMSADVKWDITKPWDTSKRFNWIVNQAVMEHCKDPIAAMKNLSEIMAYDAYLYVHVPGPHFPFHEYPIDCFRFMRDIFQVWEEKSTDLHLIDSLWTYRHVFALYRKGTNTSPEVPEKYLQEVVPDKPVALPPKKNPPKPPNIKIPHTLVYNTPEAERTSEDGYIFRSPDFKKYDEDRIKPVGETPGIKRKLDKDFCITIYSYPPHRKYLLKTLKSLAPLDFYTILSFDNHWKFPEPDILPHLDSLVIKHATHPDMVDGPGASGAHFSYIWHSLYVLPIIESFGFKYIFHMSGDCVIEKPQNFPKVLDLLGKKDMITFWHLAPPQKSRISSIGTMAWICKTKAFRQMVDYVCDRWYKPELSAGNVERKLGEAAFDLDLTIADPMLTLFDFKLPPIQRDRFSNFCKLLGLRHLQWEDRLGLLKD